MGENVSRRDFLKLAGITGAAAAVLSGCNPNEGASYFEKLAQQCSDPGMRLYYGDLSATYNCLGFGVCDSLLAKCQGFGEFCSQCIGNEDSLAQSSSKKPTALLPVQVQNSTDTTEIINHAMSRVHHAVPALGILNLRLASGLPIAAVNEAPQPNNTESRLEFLARLINDSLWVSAKELKCFGMETKDIIESHGLHQIAALQRIYLRRVGYVVNDVFENGHNSELLKQNWSTLLYSDQENSRETLLKKTHEVLDALGKAGTRLIKLENGSHLVAPSSTILQELEMGRYIQRDNNSGELKYYIPEDKLESLLNYLIVRYTGITKSLLPVSVDDIAFVSAGQELFAEMLDKLSQTLCLKLGGDLTQLSTAKMVLQQDIEKIIMSSVPNMFYDPNEKDGGFRKAMQVYLDGAIIRGLTAYDIESGCVADDDVRSKSIYNMLSILDTVKQLSYKTVQTPEGKILNIFYDPACTDPQTVFIVTPTGSSYIVLNTNAYHQEQITNIIKDKGEDALFGYLNLSGLASYRAYNSQIFINDAANSEIDFKKMVCNSRGEIINGLYAVAFGNTFLGCHTHNVPPDDFRIMFANKADIVQQVQQEDPKARFIGCFPKNSNSFSMISDRSSDIFGDIEMIEESAEDTKLFTVRTSKGDFLLSANHITTNTDQFIDLEEIKSLFEKGQISYSYENNMIFITLRDGLSAIKLSVEYFQPR